MSHAFPIDPAEVLGVDADASLDAMQAAFRAKSKKYHPDAGGDAWAFRVLVRSYELLGEARVAWRAAQEEAQARPAPTRSGPTSSSSTVPPRSAPVDREVRAGVVDADVPRERLVGVELLVIRFELDDPLMLLTTHREDRSLSVSLNLNWPILGVAIDAGEEARSESVRELDHVLIAVAKQTGTHASSTREPAGTFRGWLSYPTASEARAAFDSLRHQLRKHGFGVRQTIRNLSIPRDWQDIDDDAL
jgi:hypothetical protein